MQRIFFSRTASSTSPLESTAICVISMHGCTSRAMPKSGRRIGSPCDYWADEHQGGRPGGYLHAANLFEEPLGRTFRRAGRRCFVLSSKGMKRGHRIDGALLETLDFGVVADLSPLVGKASTLSSDLRLRVIRLVPAMASLSASHYWVPN